jgi:hypothetical protein
MNRNDAAKEAMSALLAATDHFELHAAYHRANGEEESALVNYSFVLRCGRALEALRLFFPDEE